MKLRNDDACFVSQNSAPSPQPNPSIPLHQPSPPRLDAYMHVQILREELALHARSQCQPAMAAFADCAKQHGMMVVFKCRGLNKQSAWSSSVVLWFGCIGVMDV